jgi:hypothetical protein
LVIVNLAEVLEALLLLNQVEARWLRGFLLECQVHAFVAPILLRTAGLDAFDADAEAQPVDGQSAESKERIGRGEGRAIVGAYC